MNVGFLTILCVFSSAQAPTPTPLNEAEEGHEVVLQCPVDLDVDLSKSTVTLSKDKESNFVLIYKAGRVQVDDQMEEFRNRTSLDRDGLPKGTVLVRLSSLRLSDSGRYIFYIGMHKAYYFIYLKVVEKGSLKPQGVSFNLTTKAEMSNITTKAETSNTTTKAETSNTTTKAETSNTTTKAETSNTTTKAETPAPTPTPLNEAEEGHEVVLQCPVDLDVDLSKSTVTLSKDKESNFVLIYKAGRVQVDDQMEEFRNRTSLDRDGLPKGTVLVRLSSLRLSDSGRYIFYIGMHKAYYFIYLKVVEKGSLKPQGVSFNLTTKAETSNTTTKAETPDGGNRTGSHVKYAFIIFFCILGAVILIVVTYKTCDKTQEKMGQIRHRMQIL
ncbi:uncharacterized protein LOC114857870 isoform X2 [Betta splendens]|uniref:Uncharacterized protein LOC114857870 isoform X2 n=1 Tax=Betta splendens TaxID=158456 RepID=A0A9W2XVG6_BETSP|nr:uncharacterized protein LOC114857870 isoform X2 [Betta splendens]